MIRGVDVDAIRRDHVEVARQDDGAATGHQLGGMLVQPLEPGKLVVELRTRLRVAVRQLEADDHHAVDGGLEVSRLFVGRVARKRPADLKRLRAAGQQRDPVPGRSPATRQPYPAASSSARGNTAVSVFSSWSATTSGRVVPSQASSCARRLRTLLTFQVATRTESQRVLKSVSTSSALFPTASTAARTSSGVTPDFWAQ